MVDLAEVEALAQEWEEHKTLDGHRYGMLNSFGSSQLAATIGYLLREGYLKSEHLERRRARVESLIILKRDEPIESMGFSEVDCMRRCGGVATKRMRLRVNEQEVVLSLCDDCAKCPILDTLEELIP